MNTENIERTLFGLEREGVRYLMVGGVAVIAHGYGNMTDDLDLILDSGGSNIANALKYFGTLGYVSRVPTSAIRFNNSKPRDAWKPYNPWLAYELVHEDPCIPSIDLLTRFPIDFEKESNEAVHFGFSPVLTIPIVNLETLLTIDRTAGRDLDRVVIAGLEKIRRDDRQRLGETHDGRFQMKPYPEESWGTWEGTEYENMRRTAAFTFRERMESNEGMFDLFLRFKASREAMKAGRAAS